MTIFSLANGDWDGRSSDSNVSLKFRFFFHHTLQKTYFPTTTSVENQSPINDLVTNNLRVKQIVAIWSQFSYKIFRTKLQRVYS